MKIRNIINAFTVVMLLLALGGTVIAIWSAERARFFDDRTSLAYASYQKHLQLASNTYLLFIHHGNSFLLGEADQGSRKNELIVEIRQGIVAIRGVIEQEIALVGEEELEELEVLDRLEQKIEQLIIRFDTEMGQDSRETASQRWSNLLVLHGNEVDQDFRALVDVALEEELEEVEESRAAEEAQARLAKQLAYGFAILAIVAAFYVLLYFRFNLSIPLKKLIEGVRVFASGRFDKLIHLTGNNEISEIATVLNDMAGQVEKRTLSLTEQNTTLEFSVQARTKELERLLGEAQESEVHRRQLLADVSHELRTPLTIIKGEADVALRGAEKPVEEYREALSVSREAATHTAMLVDDLLLISRTESAQMRLTLDDVDLLELLTDTIHITDKSVLVETSLKTADARVDTLRIRQSLIALLRNAKYHGGDQIIARLKRKGKGYRIMIEDNGAGFSPSEKKHAFERFFRGSNAARNYAEGAGLGLPVVRAIAEAHGGSAYIEDRPGGGAIAIIDLPESSEDGAIS